MCVTIAGISLAVVLHFIIQNSGAPTKEVVQVADPVDQQPATAPVQQAPVAQPEPVIEEPEVVEPEEVDPPEPVRPVVQEPTTKYPSHIIRGESLGKIAERYYKNHRLWKKISEYNDIDPSRLRVGQQIEIPAQSRQAETIFDAFLVYPLSLLIYFL